MGECSALSARDVSQLLREVIFGRERMTTPNVQPWDDVYAGHFIVNVDGHQISIYNDCGELDYCEECTAPDGRRWSLDSGDRFGTDPIALLSTWEHQTLHRLLRFL